MSSIKQLAVVLLMAFHLAPARCEVTVESLCFGTTTPKPIRLELRTYYDTEAKFSFALVKYEKSSTPISLTLNKAQSTIIEKSRPAELNRVWSEVIDGKVAGEYEMNSQGSNVNAFVYRNFQRKEVFSFLMLPSVETTGAGCQW